VPRALHPSLLSEKPWLTEFAGRSVTELEIVHGILADSGPARGSCAYFRDPHFTQSLPPNVRPDFEPENPVASIELGRLKRRIRDSGLTVRENYPNPEALLALVHDDLAALINSEFPAPRSGGGSEEEASLHEAYFESHRPLFAGRTSEILKLNRALGAR